MRTGMRLCYPNKGACSPNSNKHTARKSVGAGLVSCNKEFSSSLGGIKKCVELYKLACFYQLGNMCSFVIEVEIREGALDGISAKDKPIGQQVVRHLKDMRE